MLVKNVNGEAVGASMVKNSEFYIELAKFVQAYTVIIGNPNEFLVEVGEPTINDRKDRLSWAQLVKIMSRCDFGFAVIPTEIELKVFYNYALEMGSLDSVNKRVASVSEVAEAQKHYYNFVDKAKDKAEVEYQKQHKVYLSVDYGPDEALAAAADVAKIGYAAFPVKTSMWVYDGKVQVACGYGKEAKEIYNREKVESQPEN